jgi:type IV pilus biogenesis protein CpaD/CtpE
MKNLISIIPILFLILALCTAGCQTSTIISTLENVVSAAEIAIPVIGAATGLSAATSAKIVTYLQEVNIATAQAATILAGTGTSAQKAAEIAKAFAALANGCKCVPAGTPQEVVSVVEAVAQAVLNFLANFPPPAPGTIVGSSQKVSVPTIKISAADRITLANIQSRATKNAVNLKGVKK